MWPVLHHVSRISTFFTGHLACGKPQRLKVDDTCLSGMWHCVIGWVVVDSLDNYIAFIFEGVGCLVYLRGCRQSDLPVVRNYSSICTFRAGLMCGPPCVPIYKGHWDVTGVIRYMVLVNAGFSCAKEFLRKLSNIRVCTLRVFTSPLFRLKNFKRMSVWKGTKLMACPGCTCVSGWPCAQCYIPEDVNPWQHLLWEPQISQIPRNAMNHLLTNSVMLGDNL